MLMRHSETPIQEYLVEYNAHVENSRKLNRFFTRNFSSFDHLDFVHIIYHMNDFMHSLSCLIYRAVFELCKKVLSKNNLRMCYLLYLIE